MVGCLAGPALAQSTQPSALCQSLPKWAALKSALTASINPANGGLGFNMWGTIVAADGTVCAVAFSGSYYTSQWLGSRVISAQKANTGNDFSLGKRKHSRKQRVPDRARALNRQPLFGGRIRRKPLWAATQQSGRHRSRLREHPERSDQPRYVRHGGGSDGRPQGGRRQCIRRRARRL